MYCPGGNATDLIWRVLASSQGISCWTSLKPQNSNPNSNPSAQSALMYWLPYSSHTSHYPSQTRCLPWISYATQKPMLDSWKIVEKEPEAFHTFLWHFFQVQNIILLHIVFKVSSRPDCNFEIHQLWKSGFRGVYSNCCCSCSFKPEIINIGQSSHKMYSNYILNFQESTTILNARTKKSLETYWIHHVFIFNLFFLCWIVYQLSLVV